MSLILPNSPAKDNEKLTVMGRDEESSLPPWHGVGSLGDLPLLSVCCGSCRDQHLLTNSPGAAQILTMPQFCPKPPCETLQKPLRYFSKRNGKERPNFSPWIQLGKLSNPNTTKSFGAARQVFAVCSQPSHVGTLTPSGKSAMGMLLGRHYLTAQHMTSPQRDQQ